MKTGTRTQVPETARSGMPRILRLSLRSFCSSSVSPDPSSTSEPASGTTLKAIGAHVLARLGQPDAAPSWTSAATSGRQAGAHLRVELLDAGQPAPDTAW